MNKQDLTLDIIQSILVEATLGETYRALIERLTEQNSTPDNRRLPMVLEEWPGGRWYRDLGPGEGHLWGLVQVIKPPSLIEIHGPLFMSYAVAGHLQFRLTPHDDGTELSLRHRVLGLVEDAHRRGLVGGWHRVLEFVRAKCEDG